MLNVKPNQNLIIDLDSSCYNALIRILIKCLKFSPLMKAITMSEDVPLVHLSKDFSTAIYKIEDIINFEVLNRNTSILKPNFYKLLALVTPKVSIDPESIPTTYLIEMFFQMGYTGDISLPSYFRNLFLPPMWNGLFTLLFKSFSEKVLGSDSASMFFYTLISGLYHAIKLDFGYVIWAQFGQGTSSSRRNPKISFADFWSNVVNRSLIHFMVPQMQHYLMTEILMLQTTRFVMLDPRNFEFFGSIPEVLLEKCHWKMPLENAIFRDYKKIPSFGKRKDKATPFGGMKVMKKSKNPVPKPQSPSPVLQYQSKELTSICPLVCG
ncbi:unnamed protein product [Lactuca saligna]|uniref:Uncharacterized protein n=1 Tax=Lactuca saligna TaxID=75948 RepID=A0AA35YVG3_LACSI|nr:unnamed protein product [Lactuca saligna]